MRVFSCCRIVLKSGRMWKVTNKQENIITSSTRYYYRYPWYTKQISKYLNVWLCHWFIITFLTHSWYENLLHLCIACYSSSALNCTTTTHTFYPRPSKYTPSHTQTCAYFHDPRPCSVSLLNCINVYIQCGFVTKLKINVIYRSTWISLMTGWQLKGNVFVFKYISIVCGCCLINLGYSQVLFK